MQIPTFLQFVQGLGVTPEPGQRVFWSVAADGVQPKDLTGDAREVARQMFGDVDEIDDAARGVVSAVKGAEIGWSFFMGLRLLYRAVFADVSDAAPGEIRPALCVAPDLRLGRVPVRVARQFAEGHPSIRRMLEPRSAGADGFVLLRENGRKTSVECLPASVGGRATRGRRYVEVSMDEACQFRDENGAISDAHVFQSVAPRCKGTVWLGSTPWLPSNLCWKLVEDNWGKHATAIGARLPTELVRTDPKVLSAVVRARRVDPLGAAVEFDCELPSSSSLFFSLAALDSSVDPAVPERSVERGTVFAAIDVGFRRDASALVVVRIDEGRVVVAEVIELRPAKGEPLRPSEVARRFADAALAHGCQAIMADSFYIESIREHVGKRGLRLVEAPAGAGGKLRTYDRARTLLAEGKIRFSPQHAALIDQIRSITAQPVSGGGLAIRQPRSKGKGGGHADACSAWVLAVYQAGKRLRQGPPVPRRRPSETSGYAWQRQGGAPDFEVDETTGRVRVAQRTRTGARNTSMFGRGGVF